MFRVEKYSIHSFSRVASAGVPSSNKSARSMRATAWRVRSTRFSPSSPQSSYPAVSASTAAPMPGSSIFFHTVSVVVPATSETIDVSCPVMQFISEDFPALRRPKIPIWYRLERAVLFMSFYLLKSEVALAILYCIKIFGGSGAGLFVWNVCKQAFNHCFSFVACSGRCVILYILF